MAQVPKSAMDEEKEVDRQDTNNDGDRQVLAPVEGPRENLISTAIKFLQNPKVMGSPLLQKKAFLSKKGLTQEEIDLAVERAGVHEMAVATSSPPPPGYPSSGLMTHAVAPAYGPPIPRLSRWAQLRDLTLTSVVVVGVSYGMYHLYKMYIEPLIRGKSAHEKRLDRLESEVEAIHKSVSESLSDISKTLAAIQLSVNNQNQQSSSNHNVGRGITDLKADISSLRSLLLSKNQFPPPPTNPPVLPSWQLAGVSPITSQQTSSSTVSEPSDSPTTDPRSSEQHDASAISMDSSDQNNSYGSNTQDSQSHPEHVEVEDQSNHMQGAAGTTEESQSS